MQGYPAIAEEAHLSSFKAFQVEKVECAAGRVPVEVPELAALPRFNGGTDRVQATSFQSDRHIRVQKATERLLGKASLSLIG